MTKHGRVLDVTPEAERIAALESRLATLETALRSTLNVVALEAELVALKEAVDRMAAYLGVTHVLIDPRV